MSLLFDPNYQANMAAANADSLLKDAMGTSSGSTGERKYRSRSRYGTEIEKLETGDFFGHKGLLQRDEGSLYSAFANEPLELLAVTVDDFSHILLQSFQEDFHTKAEFLSGLEFFSGWSPHLIRQLVFTLREKRHHPGDCIFRQDIQTHCLYLVKSGSIKLSTHCSKKAPNELVEKIEPEKDFLAEILAEDQPKDPPAIDSLSKVSLVSGLSRVSLVSGMSQVFLRRESTATPLRRESVAHVLRTRESKENLMSLTSASRRVSLTPAAMLNLIASEKKKNKKISKPERKPSTSTKPVHLLGFKLHEPSPDNTIEICNLGPGEFLGEIEAMCRLKYHLFNAVCMTTTVVYEVNLFYIEQLLQKKAPRTLYFILQHIIQKVESWQERHRCIQFFKPLTVVLDQADRRMTTEGANKPIRRQHHYDASTLALMATRSLGKPILFAVDRERRKSVEFVVNDGVKDVSCTPFSSLYGSCANPLLPASNQFPVKRCLSSPANLTVNRTLATDSSKDLISLPSTQANISSNPSKPPRLRHRSAPPTSSRRIPKPTLKKKFSFDTPPPRQYRTRPNLMSSAKFPVPPPSPYPFKEDQNMVDSLKENDEEEQSEDDRIEIICLDSSSPVHSCRERRRCRSANVRRLCTRSPLPIRPSTAIPFSISNKSRSVTPISIDDFSPLSTPSKKVTDDASVTPAHTPSDVSLSEYVDNDELLLRSSTTPPRVTTATPIVIPMATTSEADLHDQTCGDTTDEGLPNEESQFGENRTEKRSDSLSEAEHDPMAAEKNLYETGTDSSSVGHSSGSAINAGQYKQVRISDKLEFLGSKHLSIAPHEATILPMKEVGNSQLQTPKGKNAINTHSLVQALAVATHDRDKLQLDDSENNTTIPKEYARLQEGSRSNSRSPKPVTSPENTSNRANEAAQDQGCEWNSTDGTMATYDVMQTGGEHYLRESSASPTCKCISISFAAPLEHQTR